MNCCLIKAFRTWPLRCLKARAYPIRTHDLLTRVILHGIRISLIDHFAPIGGQSSWRPFLCRSLNYGYIYLKHHEDPKKFCHLVSDRLNVITVLADVVGVLADAVPRLPGVRVVVEAAAVEVVARTSVLPMTPRERYVGSKCVVDQRVLEQRRKDERDANALMGMSKNPH